PVTGRDLPIGRSAYRNSCLLEDLRPALPGGGRVVHVAVAAGNDVDQAVDVRDVDADRDACAVRHGQQVDLRRELGGGVRGAQVDARGLRGRAGQCRVVLEDQVPAQAGGGGVVHVAVAAGDDVDQAVDVRDVDAGGNACVIRNRQQVDL